MISLPSAARLLRGIPCFPGQFLPSCREKGPCLHWEHQTSCSEQSRECQVPLSKHQGQNLPCVCQEPRETTLGAAEPLCRARGRPGRAEILTQLLWGALCQGQLSPFPRVTRAIGTSLRCVTPSPAASLSGGLQLSNPRLGPCQIQKKKLNETETSLPRGHLMLA